MPEPSAPSRERDEFDRITRLAEIERDRELIAQYEEGMAFYRGRIEDYRYQLGRIDQRLGG
jgi:hypothetical protein